MDKKQCKDCKYYLQHYGFCKGKLYRVFCGHCTFTRARRKQPDAKACDHFVAGLDDAEAFATKEYLSKKLLQYVLNLELLPEITDLPQK